MATTEQYAKWCVMLMDGDDHVVDDIWDALHEDGYVDQDGEWDVEDED